MSHKRRAELKPRHPVHVTVKLKPGLPGLRTRATRAVLLAAFAAGCHGTVAAGAAGSGRFRLVHFVITDNHFHLLVEAEDRGALSRGLAGLLIRIARALNRLWKRKGKVFADRYHDSILQCPLQVRNAIRYVLGNARKHAAEGGPNAGSQAIDVFSSAPWFDGFVESITVRGLEKVPRPVADARTWLMNVGWRMHGLLSVHDLPARV